MKTLPTPPRNSVEWFANSRYLPAARFETNQWIQQIAKRAVVRKAVEANDRTTLDLMVPQLMSDPLSAFTFQYNNANRAVRQLEYATGAVVPLAFGDLNRLQGLRADFPSTDSGAIDEWSNTDEQLAAVRDFAHLKIDLNARDKDIKASFAAWLKVYRAEANVPSSMKAYRKTIAHEAANWHSSGVLPYFDLTAWMAWSGAKVTQDKIAGMLFPDDATGIGRDKLGPIKKKTAQILTMATAMTLSVRR